MPGFGRDQTPVLFTVVTSVASGLIVAGTLNLVRNGVSGGTTVVWFSLTALGVAAISGAAWAFYRRGKHARRAFLITSAFSQKYFVAAFVQRIHSALDRNGIDLVLKVPDRDYDASAQSHHLSRILERRRDYAGGIIIATEAHRLRSDLNRFCHISALPVVFTDIEPFDEESEYPKNSAFVGYDTGALGELAGKWLIRRLQNKERPHVLIVASREHPARQQRCEQTLRLGLPKVSITIDDGCEFTRSRAYRAVRTHISELDPGQCLDAVFCTNDEMALGAVDALPPAIPATQSTVVVGIDGVLEAKALIDTADSPLRATVVQDTHQLAICIVDVLEKMRRGSKVAKRTILNADIYEAARE